MPTTVTYLFDPLCGWCYGATPSLDKLAAALGLNLKLAPTGMFADEGARPMDAWFAAYAWSNDQRIAQLRGAGFLRRLSPKLSADARRDVGFRPSDAGAHRGCAYRSGP
jgi:putative protein-disulfide isomerase